MTTKANIPPGIVEEIKIFFATKKCSVKKVYMVWMDIQSVTERMKEVSMKWIDTQSAKNRNATDIVYNNKF